MGIESADVPSNTVTQSPVPPVQPIENSPRVKKNYLSFLLSLFFFLFIAVPVLTYFLINLQMNTELKELTKIPTSTPFFLNIYSPSNEINAVNGEVLISGKTLPNTTVLIYSDSDEASLESDADGKFEGTLLVNETGGLIKVTAFGDNGEEKSKTILLGQPNEISSIGSNVLGKSDSAPGQIKDVPPVKPQKEEKDNGNSNNKVNTEIITEFLQTNTEKSKPVKIGSLKVKEILSLEATDSSTLKNSLKLQKMEAKEASSSAQLKRHAVSGIITAVSGGIISISHQIQHRTYLIYVNESTVVSMKNFKNALPSDLIVGMRIAAVGEPVDDGILAKLIHVIPGKAIGVFNKQPAATEEGDILLTPSPEVTVSTEPSLTPEINIADTPTPTPLETPVFSI